MNETTQQTGDCEALSSTGVREHESRKFLDGPSNRGDVLGLRFSSQLAAAGSR